MKVLIRIILLSVAVSAILSAYTSGNMVFGSDDERISERMQERIKARAIRRAEMHAEKRALLRAESIQTRVMGQTDKMEDRMMARRESEARNATALVRRALLSQRRSELRRELRQTMRKNYALSLIERNNKEILVRTGEIVALNISIKGLKAAKDLGLKNIRSNQLDGLNIKVDIFEVKSNKQFSTIMDQLKQVDPEGEYEFNQVYKMSGGEIDMSIVKLVANKVSNATFTVGVIDTGVYEDAGPLRNATITQKNFGRGETVIPRNHGTAVSSIIAHHGKVNFLIADVFSGPAGYGDSESIVRALDWMALSQIGVINMSLAGPDNALLRYAVTALTNKGHIIVASVGNEGPKGVARYPASYNDVIGVTAVDENLNIYIKANQGSAVDISAPGVNILASSIKGEQLFSGTSFAAPFVSASLAPLLTRPDREMADLAWQDVVAETTDLGAKGFDPVFGVGYLKIKKIKSFWNK